MSSAEYAVAFHQNPRRATNVNRAPGAIPKDVILDNKRGISPSIKVNRLAHFAVTFISAVATDHGVMLNQDIGAAAKDFKTIPLGEPDLVVDETNVSGAFDICVCAAKHS